MEALLIVKAQILPQSFPRFAGAGVIFEVNLSEGVTPSARLQNRA